MITPKSRSVSFTELTPAMAFMLYALEKFHRLRKVNQPDNLVITSLNDGQHSPNSRHYKNEAMDIRSKTFTSRDDKRVFRQEFELFLGPSFRVILEDEGTDNEHFHVQVKKGLVYIP